jgi:hypothetical protein
LLFAVCDQAAKTSESVYAEHPKDIDTIGVGLELIPGADVVIEVDTIRVMEK